MCNKSVVPNVRDKSRSYLEQNEHGLLRINRGHLYKTNLKPPVFNEANQISCQEKDFVIS